MESANDLLATLRQRIENMKLAVNLTPDQVAFVAQRAGMVNPTLKNRFDRAYTAWKATWNHPLIAVSSAPVARAQTTEFLELISLGTDILPLLIEKLTHPEEFFALVAVDQLIPPTLRVIHQPQDEAILLGEQGRAIETIQRWIQNES